MIWMGARSSRSLGALLMALGGGAVDGLQAQQWSADLGYASTADVGGIQGGGAFGSLSWQGVSWAGASLSGGAGGSSAPRWASADLSLFPQVQHGRWTAGWTTSSSAYGYSDPSWGTGMGATLWLNPWVQRRALGWDWRADVSHSRALLRWDTIGSTSSASQASVTLARSFGSAGTLWMAGGYLSSQSEGSTFARLGTRAQRGFFEGQASAEHWQTPQGTVWGGSATGRYFIRDQWTLWVDATRTGWDPMYGTTGRTRLSSGISFRFGAQQSSPSALPVVPVRVVQDQWEVRLPGEWVQGSVWIAGDFTGWQRVAMTREGNDWIFRLPLKPGVYRFSFVDNSGNWFVPSAWPDQEDDGMGGVSARLWVSP